MTERAKKKIFGRTLILLATLIWGSSFVILKDTLSNLGGGNFTFFILALRFLLSFIIFFCLFPKRIFAVKRKTVINGVILGVILFCGYVVQTIGLIYTTPSKNAFLTTIYCVFVPFLAVVLLKNEKPRLQNYLAGILCFIGVILVAFFGKNESVPNEFIGDILSMVSGLFYAFQMIFNKKYSSEEDFVQLLTVEFLVVGGMFAVVSLSYEFPFHMLEFTFPPDAIWKILYLAFFATFFAQVAQFVGQKYTTPTSASIIMTFESVFALLFEIILSTVYINGYIIAGFIVIFLAEIISELRFKKKKLEPLKKL